MNLYGDNTDILTNPVQNSTDINLLSHLKNLKEIHVCQSYSSTIAIEFVLKQYIGVYKSPFKKVKSSSCRDGSIHEYNG